MNYFIKGITYSSNRNIAWQDRTIRTIFGIAAIIGAVYFFRTNSVLAFALVVFALAQAWTVISAKCIVCYFIGQCTISKNEKKSLDSKGILHA